MLRAFLFLALLFSFISAEMISIGGGGARPTKQQKVSRASDSKYSFSGFTIGTNLYFINHHFLETINNYNYNRVVNIYYPYNMNIGYIFKNSFYVGVSTAFAYDNNLSSSYQEIAITSFRIAKNVYSPRKGHKTLIGLSYKYLSIDEYNNNDTRDFEYEQGAISLDLGYILPVSKHILIEALFSIDLGTLFEYRSGNSVMHPYLLPYGVDTSTFNFGVKFVF